MIELRLEQAGFACRDAIVQHQIGAGRMQTPAGRGADTLGSSGDQHDFALHAALRLHFGQL